MVVVRICLLASLSLPGTDLLLVCVHLFSCIHICEVLTNVTLWSLWFSSLALLRGLGVSPDRRPAALTSSVLSLSPSFAGNVLRKPCIDSSSSVFILNYD